MKYNFEKFKDKGIRINTPIITIHNKVTVSYSAFFIRNYKLENCNGVIYYYDKDKKVLGIKFCKEDYCYKIGKNKNKNNFNRTSAINSFITKNNINIPLTYISTPKKYKDNKLGNLFLVNL